VVDSLLDEAPEKPAFVQRELDRLAKEENPLIQLSIENDIQIYVLHSQELQLDHPVSAIEKGKSGDVYPATLFESPVVIKFFLSQYPLNFLQNEFKTTVLSQKVQSSYLIRLLGIAVISQSGPQEEGFLDKIYFRFGLVFEKMQSNLPTYFDKFVKSEPNTTEKISHKINIAVQILTCLDNFLFGLPRQIHGLSIVLHRDIKPQNFQIISKFNGAFQIKMHEFGVANFFGLENSAKIPILPPDKNNSSEALVLRNPSTKQDEFCGSKLFAAPEILSGSDHMHNMAKEVWSIGVLFYYLFYEDLTPIELLVEKWKRGTLENPEISVNEKINNDEQISNFLKSLLQCSPNLRIHFDSLRDDLGRIKEKYEELMNSYHSQSLSKRLESPKS